MIVNGIKRQYLILAIPQFRSYWDNILNEKEKSSDNLSTESFIHTTPISTSIAITRSTIAIHISKTKKKLQYI